jgi:hypothetical protein
MGAYNIVKKVLMISYGAFIVIVTGLIVTAICFGIKYALETKTSLNKESITAITVFSGLALFIILVAPIFFGVSFGFLGSFMDSLFPDFN